MPREIKKNHSADAAILSAIDIIKSQNPETTAADLQLLDNLGIEAYSRAYAERYCPPGTPRKQGMLVGLAWATALQLFALEQYA